MAAAAVWFATPGCSNNDDLWGAIGDLEDRVTAVEDAVKKANSDLEALHTLVNALQNRITIDSVVADGDGYIIKLSDGRTVNISDGRNGHTPVISVALDSDGLYYWTLDGEFMLDADGAKVRASAVDGKNGENGKDGADGKDGKDGVDGENGADGKDGADGIDGKDGRDGVTPKIRINEDTGEWEYSLDDGETWTSTGVKAAGDKGDKGEKGDSFFADVRESAENVVFELIDGTILTLPKTVALSIAIVRDGSGVESFRELETKIFDVETVGVADWIVSHPDGWKASFDGVALKITAPSADNAYADKEGDVAVMVTAANGAGKIAKMAVSVSAGEGYELRILTFEDEDYKGSNGAGYWTSMIDKEYGGPLLYGDYDYCDYQWCDDGNTMLTSGLVEVYDMRVFWNGGHAVSNYLLTDRAQGDYTRQLSVYNTDPTAVYGGHNGSKNFCIHFGYTDFFSFSSSLPDLKFSDGVERVIDHMFVMITTYTAHSLLDGDGFTPAAGEDDWFGIVVAGFDSEGNETGTVSMNLFEPGRKMIQDWTKVDLSSLGKVASVKFNCAGSMKGSYGLNTPAYFAFDDVAVRF